ncbi:hypothetical protein ACR78Z_05980 [Sphingobacterium thalpophilum]|uniref:hypothetical protein n=1 Tax=Sphingobacterium thalpophilum TaxID=259 RepID=UPI002D769A01|nr:hypothetical protein [Sphingobacterium thalpophilum]
MKKSLQTTNGIALVTTIIISYLSNKGVFNGETMGTISAKYENLFTPAGYAFSIWGLIYLLLFGFIIYFGPITRQTQEKECVLKQIGWWFVISCFANSLWVLIWLYDFTFCSVLFMILLLLSLLTIIEKTEEGRHRQSAAMTIFLRLPFQIYAGWVSVALIANVAAYLKKIAWNGFGISETSWTIALFVFALVIHLFMIWKRGMPAFALVAVWALLAIAVANHIIDYTIYIAAIVSAVTIFINIIIFFVRKSKDPLTR